MDKMWEEYIEWVNSFLDDEKDTLDLYDAWKASRKALVVELPDFFVSGIEAALYRDDVIEALDGAGVSYE